MQGGAQSTAKPLAISAFALALCWAVKLELEAGTDAGAFLLYDPTSLDAPAESASFTARMEQLHAAVSSGHALSYSYAADGSSLLHLYLDQRVPQMVLRRIERTHRGLLRIPSGQVRYAGIEYLGRPATGTMATEATVPPGDYEVTAYELEWGEAASNAADRAAEKADGRGATWSSLGGFGCAFSVLLALCGGSAIWALRQSEPAPDFWRWVQRIVIGWAVWVTASVILLRLPSSKRAEAARRQTRHDFPEVVVELTRLTALPPDLVGCTVGEPLPPGS